MKFIYTVNEHYQQSPIIIKRKEAFIMHMEDAERWKGRCGRKGGKDLEYREASEQSACLLQE